MANTLVAIDSMIFAWGVKASASEGQEDQIPIAEAFLRQLDEDKCKILLPTPVITETLARITKEEDREALMDKIYQRFRLGALDDIAARIAGAIWADNPNWKDFYEGEHRDGIRNKFKYDLLILGICMRNNIDCLFSHDKDLAKLGGKIGLSVMEMTVRPMQGSLFPRQKPHGGPPSEVMFNFGGDEDPPF